MHLTETFRFAGHEGHQLDGRLERPKLGLARGVAIFAHCFTCGKDIRAATFIARQLAATGYEVLRFDFAGLGGSEGDLQGFAGNVEDLVAAADALRVVGKAPTLLIGHSLGGAAVIAAAGRIAEVKAVATIGAPFEVDHVLHHFGAHLDTIEKEGKAEVRLVGRPFCITKEFVAETRGHDQKERLANLDRALLVMHAPQDETVPLDNAAGIYTAAKHPKSFISLDGADHLLSREQDARYAANLIAAWAERYLAPMDAAGEPVLDGTVRVSTAGGKFAQTVATPTHTFIADEPKSYGGDDSGPTPYDLLLSALGTCTSMTIKMYADRKGIPLEKVRIELGHSRDHAQDSASDVDGASDKIEVIDRSIELIGDLTDEQRARLMEIADRCPVHRTLEGELHIHSTEVR